MKCESCWYYKRQFPFDPVKGKCHYQWGFCSNHFKYLRNECCQMLYPIKLLRITSNPLFPLDLTNIERTWRGDFQWKPFNPETCAKYLNRLHAVEMLLEKE